MRRGVAAAALLVCLSALGDCGWAQQAAPGRRGGREGTAQAQTGARPKAGEPAVRHQTEGKGAPVTVDADRLESLQKEGLVVFTGNVVASQNSSTHYADRMEVYLDEKGDRIVRTVSSGNVRIITRDCRLGTAQRAEYYDAEQRVVLIGNARVWREDNVVTGERIIIYLAEDRSVVEGGKQERVKAVFYSRGQAEARPDVRSAGGQCN